MPHKLRATAAVIICHELCKFLVQLDVCVPNFDRRTKDMPTSGGRAAISGGRVAIGSPSTERCQWRAELGTLAMSGPIAKSADQLTIWHADRWRLRRRLRRRRRHQIRQPGTERRQRRAEPRRRPQAAGVSQAACGLGDQRPCRERGVQPRRRLPLGARCAWRACGPSDAFARNLERIFSETSVLLF